MRTIGESLIRKILCVIVFALCWCHLVCCSDTIGLEGSDDYIEVTVDGKTFKESIPFVAYYGRYDLCWYQYNGDRVSFEFTYAMNLNKTASTPTGSYRLFGLYGNNDLGDHIFDLWVAVHDKYEENMRCVKNGSGSNTVTMVEMINDEVIVKGKFRGKLDDGSEISGKYKLTLD